MKANSEAKHLQISKTAKTEIHRLVSFLSIFLILRLSFKFLSSANYENYELWFLRGYKLLFKRFSKNESLFCCSLFVLTHSFLLYYLQHLLKHLQKILTSYLLDRMRKIKFKGDSFFGNLAQT